MSSSNSRTSRWFVCEPYLATCSSTDSSSRAQIGSKKHQTSSKTQSWTENSWHPQKTNMKNSKMESWKILSFFRGDVFFVGVPPYISGFLVPKIPMFSSMSSAIPGSQDGCNASSCRTSFRGINCWCAWRSSSVHWDLWPRMPVTTEN